MRKRARIATDGLLPKDQIDNFTVKPKSKKNPPRSALPLRKWNIDIEVSFKGKRPKKAAVRSIVRSILQAVDLSTIPKTVNSLCLTLTGDREIHAMNLQYRGKDKPTDVLSFPQLGEDVDPVVQSLGDIVISLDTTRRQAPKYGNTFSEELLRLLIHGILHLLGHDHEGVPKSVAAKMRRIERKIFNELHATSVMLHRR
jgi:probable rRNA maturation factor